MTASARSSDDDHVRVGEPKKEHAAGLGRAAGSSWGGPKLGKTSHCEIIGLVSVYSRRLPERFQSCDGNREFFLGPFNRLRKRHSLRGESGANRADGQLAVGVRNQQKLSLGPPADCRRPRSTGPSR